MEQEELQPKKSRVAMIMVFTFILGLFVGLLIHDTVLQHVEHAFDMKSWYPR